MFLLVFSSCCHWWICSLVWLVYSLFFITFFILIIFFIFYFTNFIYLFFFLSFFLPFLLSHVADSVLVLWLALRNEPLRWESRVQHTGPPEASQPHVISISKSSPRDLHLNVKTQFNSTTSKLQCWIAHAKQLARQEHNAAY